MANNPSPQDYCSHLSDQQMETFIGQLIFGPNHKLGFREVHLLLSAYRVRARDGSLIPSLEYTRYARTLKHIRSSIPEVRSYLDNLITDKRRKDDHFAGIYATNTRWLAEKHTYDEEMRAVIRVLEAYSVGRHRTFEALVAAHEEYSRPPPPRARYTRRRTALNSMSGFGDSRTGGGPRVVGGSGGVSGGAYSAGNGAIYVPIAIELPANFVIPPGGLRATFSSILAPRPPAGSNNNNSVGALNGSDGAGFGTGGFQNPFGPPSAVPAGMDLGNNSDNNTQAQAPNRAQA